MPQYRVSYDIDVDEYNAFQAAEKAWEIIRKQVLIPEECDMPVMRVRRVDEYGNDIEEGVHIETDGVRSVLFDTPVVPKTEDTMPETKDTATERNKQYRVMLDETWACLSPEEAVDRAITRILDPTAKSTYWSVFEGGGPVRFVAAHAVIRVLCPYCGSEDVDHYQPVMFDTDDPHQHATCNTCGKTMNVVYGVRAVEKIEGEDG